MRLPSAIIKAAPIEIKHLLDNTKNRAYFDPMCYNAEVVQTVDEGTSVMYFMNRKFMVTRDFCVLRHSRISVRICTSYVSTHRGLTGHRVCTPTESSPKDTSTLPPTRSGRPGAPAAVRHRRAPAPCAPWTSPALTVLSRSLPFFPFPQGYLRGVVLNSGFVMFARGKGECLMSYMTQVNMAGWLPGTLTESALEQQVLRVLKRLREYFLARERSSTTPSRVFSIQDDVGSP